MLGSSGSGCTRLGPASLLALVLRSSLATKRDLDGSRSSHPSVFRDALQLERDVKRADRVSSTIME